MAQILSMAQIMSSTGIRFRIFDGEKLACEILRFLQNFQVETHENRVFAQTEISRIFGIPSFRFFRDFWGKSRFSHLEKSSCAFGHLIYLE